jgi:vacuolar-type H+-ATPase subunit E/Vma4
MAARGGPPMTAAPDLATALAPVRNALVQAARADVTKVLGEAADRADAATATARRRAETAHTAARAAGAADANQTMIAARTSHQRQARARSLHVGRDAYEQLHQRVRAAAGELATGPDYGGLRATLVTAAHRLLGPEAVITEAPGGGIFAESGNRRLDLSLAAFAERAADRIAVRLART